MNIAKYDKLEKMKTQLLLSILYSITIIIMIIIIVKTSIACHEQTENRHKNNSNAEPQKHSFR